MHVGDLNAEAKIGLFQGDAFKSKLHDPVIGSALKCVFTPVTDSSRSTRGKRRCFHVSLRPSDGVDASFRAQAMLRPGREPDAEREAQAHGAEGRGAFGSSSTWHVEVHQPSLHALGRPGLDP